MLDDDDEHRRHPHIESPSIEPRGADDIGDKFCAPEKIFYILAVALMLVILQLCPPQVWLLTTGIDTAILRPL